MGGTTYTVSDLKKKNFKGNLCVKSCASKETGVNTSVVRVTCVYFQMLVEGVPLSKASAALLAFIGPGPSVDVGVMSQVFLGCKALPTGLTHKGFLA